MKEILNEWKKFLDEITSADMEKIRQRSKEYKEEREQKYKSYLEKRKEEYAKHLASLSPEEKIGRAHV